GGQLDRTPSGVDVALLSREPVRELQRRIAECVGQRVAKAPPAISAGSQSRHQLAQGTGVGQAAPQQAYEEGERNRREGHERDEEGDLLRTGRGAGYVQREKKPFEGECGATGPQHRG